MAFDRRLVRELHGFDEAFRFGADEEEFCRRAHARGPVCFRYQPDAIVTHRFSPSVCDILRRARATAGTTHARR